MNGVSDHVHIVATLPRTVSQADMVEKIKANSSRWIKTLGAKFKRFAWQRGYSALSVSQSQLGAVLKYVESQEEHHRNRTFQEEYAELLLRHKIKFDERFVWD